MFRIAPLGLAALVLAGCDTAATADLTARVEALEAKVASIESRPAEPGGPSDRDRKAYETFQELQAAVQKSDYEAAKALIATMEKEYSDIPAAMQAIAEVKKEIELIGSDAQDFEAIKWFTGKPTSLLQGKATLVVFWEVWCPHCRREVPRIEEVHAKFGGQGLTVIGLTQVNNDRTDEVRDLVVARWGADVAPGGVVDRAKIAERRRFMPSIRLRSTHAVSAASARVCTSVPSGPG
jgi:thiol-disulfide isomerase/thioredoxin